MPFNQEVQMNIESKHHILGLISTFVLSTLLLIAIPATIIANSPKPQEVSAVTIITAKSSDQYISDYYSSISDSQTGLALAASLESRLQSERTSSFSYGSLQTTAFPYTDVDPNRPNDGYIVSFYSGTPVNGYVGMNKEHTWPNSHGGGYIENDPHMVRPTLTSENSARGNAYYADSPSQGWDPNSFGNDKYRGIAARIIFYGAVIGYTEGLRLEDVGFVSGSGNGGRMGKLSDLLTWNFQYPIDQSEIIRNETLDSSLNYNRNPFIDNPSYACRIWGSTNSTTQSICTAQNVEPTSISISPNTATVNMGSTVDLTIGVTPSNANNSVTWSTNNSNVATVSNGTVTPVGVGQATITATSTVNTSIKGTATITVTNETIAVSSISLNKSSESLAVGNTTTLVATISPSNASNKNVTWSSSNPGVASINSSTGLITGLSAGTTTITVTTVDGNKTDTCLLTVNVATNKTATYTISAKNTLTLTGEAPSESSASIVETYSTSTQITGGNSQTVTLSGWNNLRITGITLSMKSNSSSGAGNFTYSVNNGSDFTTQIATAGFNTPNWYGSWSTSPVPIEMTGLDIVASTSNLIFKISATANSLYCYSYSFTYEQIVTSKTLSSIAVTTQPANKIYDEGESFNPEGLVITATYSDSSINDVTSGCTYSPDPLTLGTTSVTVSYTEGLTKTTTISGIIVNAVTISSIAVKTPASTTTFTIGSTFNASGLAITVTYSNETTEDLTTGFEVTGVDTSKLGQQTAIITYGSKTTSYTVNVTNNNASVSSGSGSNATDLFISEYIEGNIGNNKALEIFNGTGSAVSLANYTVALYSNGATSATSTESLSTFASTLENGQVLSIVNSDSTAAFKVGNYITSTVTYFNGNDAVALLKNGTAIDVIGVIGEDPGTAWTDGTKSTANKTLVRSSSITSPNATFTFSEWDAYAADTSTYIGSHDFDSGPTLGDITASEQAIAWAQYFLNTTGPTCLAMTGSFSSYWTDLADEYDYMVIDAKDIFVENAESNTTIANAKARYEYIVQKYGMANFVTDGSGAKMIPTEVTNHISKENDLMVIIAIITIFSGTSVCAALLLRNKKRSSLH